MTTYVRPAAVARSDADMIVGWNISPNTGYTLQVTVTSGAVVAILSNADGSALIGSGMALVGVAQPVTITPVSGQTISMADSSLGWHLLITTNGTEGDRTIQIDPMVDLAARTHPVYADDALALAAATADIDAGTHYVRDVTVTCPLEVAAEGGDIVSVPMDGEAVTGQVESVTWSGDADGTSASVVVRAVAQIRPAAYVAPPAPPAVVDDTAETDAGMVVSGNVLTNDTGDTLIVSAVNGLSANVGQIVTGSSGGDFVINADGAWTFDPSGDFSGLSGSETVTTSVAYHASDGQAEASATLTVTVTTTAPAADPYWDSVLLLVQAPETGSSIIDARGHTVTLYENIAVASAIGPNSIYFDGSGDIARVPYTPDLDWASGNWTVEFLLYPKSVASGTIFCDAVSGGGFYAIRVLFGSAKIWVFMYDSSNTEFLVDCGPISANVLGHFAVQRSGTTLNMYKNGSFVTSRSIVAGRSMKAMSAPYSLGGYVSTDYYYGHLVAFRKTNGVVRYVAEFTPPTWPLVTY